jgi:hypothetical protein
MSMSEDDSDTSGLHDISLPMDSQVGMGSPQAETLRNRARTALLSRRKAEARDILGKLVTLSEDPADRRNLEELIKGVDEELRKFTLAQGDLRTRLMNRIPLLTIQEELSQRMPYWRAFANDLPELALARTGLPPHEDPTLKERLGKLEMRLAAGEVLPVLEEWENMGTPAAAANPGFVQLVEILGKLGDQIEARSWKMAQTVHAEAAVLLEGDECAGFRDGTRTYLRLTEDIIRWESLLGECKVALPTPGRAEKQRLAEALYAATDGIARRVGKEPGLKNLQTRLSEMRDAIESAAAAPTRAGSGVKWTILILLLIVVILAAIWFWFGIASSQSLNRSIHAPVVAHSTPAPNSNSFPW